LCDAHLTSEIFAEDTVPTETCDVHYSGTVCGYSMLPACETCPFKTEGVFELPLPEDESLWEGSASAAAAGLASSEGTIIENEDGTVRHMCIHNAAYMADPNIDTLLAAQQLEMQQRAANAASALAAAGIQATEGDLPALPASEGEAVPAD